MVPDSFRASKTFRAGLVRARLEGPSCMSKNLLRAADYAALVQRA